MRIQGAIYSALADSPLVNMSWHICFAAYAGPRSAKNKSDMNDLISANDIRDLTRQLLKMKFTTDTCLQFANLQKDDDNKADVIAVKAATRGDMAVGSEIILLQVRMRLEEAGIEAEPQHHNKLNKRFTFSWGKPEPLGVREGAS